jgi:hypothetical protein
MFHSSRRFCWLYIRWKLLKVCILFNCVNKIFLSYGTFLRGKTLAGYLSFPFIILTWICYKKHDIYVLYLALQDYTLKYHVHIVPCRITSSNNTTIFIKLITIGKLNSQISAVLCDETTQDFRLALHIVFHVCE